MPVYSSVDASQPHRLRGTLQQTDTGLLYLAPGYKVRPAEGGAATTLRTPGLAIGSFSLHNRSAAAGVHGIGVRIENFLWKAGQWTDATTTYVDDTPAAQDTVTNDFPLETTTANDGFVVLSRVPFNAISFNVSTASVDAVSVARATRFSNLAGTGWQTTDPNVFIHDGVATNYATGENLIVWAPPVDWGKSLGLATGLPDGYYAMQVRATDAPTTAGIAASMELFRLYELTEAVADNATLEKQYGMGELVMADDGAGLLYGDALVALFGTANDMNRVSVQVRAV